MTGATTWHGRRGAVILGPTEARIARYLEHATRHGRITLRTVELAEATQLERSEAYRITARLRVLGLFGIQNDRGGARVGRRYWRTRIEHDGQLLDGARHRTAWSRIVGWARMRRDRLHSRLAELHASMAGSAVWPIPRRLGPATLHKRPVDAARGAAEAMPRAPNRPPGAHGSTFAEAMRRHGLGPLMDEWARPRVAR